MKNKEERALGIARTWTALVEHLRGLGHEASEVSLAVIEGNGKRVNQGAQLTHQQN